MFQDSEGFTCLSLVSLVQSGVGRNNLLQILKRSSSAFLGRQVGLLIRRKEMSAVRSARKTITNTGTWRMTPGPHLGILLPARGTRLIPGDERGALRFSSSCAPYRC